MKLNACPSDRQAINGLKHQQESQLRLHVFNCWWWGETDTMWSKQG